MIDSWTNQISALLTQYPLLLATIKSVLLAVVLLIYVAYIILADRKIWAAVQLRRGPNVVGPWGLLQSFADFLNLLSKSPLFLIQRIKAFFFCAFLDGHLIHRRLGGCACR